VEIVYENGIFQYGSTRGDGDTGKDISANLRTIHSVPLRIQRIDGLPRMLAVRGEVFMLKKGFQELNRAFLEKGEEPFANPRSATAGLLRQLDPRMVAGRPLDVRFYDVLRSEGYDMTSYWDMLQRFDRWELKVDPQSERCVSFEDTRSCYQRLIEKRDELDYEIDGMVIKKDIREGDRVRVARARDVISEVIERIEEPGKKRGKPFSISRHCRAYGTIVRKEGAFYRCLA